MDSFYNRSTRLEITTDASPWGLGAWLSLNGKPLSWFAIPVTESDCAVLNRQIGSHESQQAFEALVLLVAVRVWQRLWQTKRICLAVRSDNVGALSVLSAFRGKGHALNIVARELALVLGTYEHAPAFIEHIPGVANSTADVVTAI